jgi:integrase
MLQQNNLTILPVALAPNWQDQFKSYLEADHRKVTHRQLDDKSIRLASQHMRRFGLWYQAQFSQAFEPVMLTNYDLHLYRKVSLENEKVKAATWNSRMWALGIFSLWIGRPELMDGIEQKAQGRASTKHRSLASDEYHRLVHTIELDPRRALSPFEAYAASRNWAVVSLMLFAGLRVEEAWLVQVEDITIGERSGEVFVRNGKGSKERNVPLNLMARRALSQYLTSRPASGSLFDISIRTMQRIVSDLGQRINVPDMTCHWLRYHFAKSLEKAGKPIEMIRDLLGHTSIEITRRYLRSSMEDLQSAVEEVM